MKKIVKKVVAKKAPVKKLVKAQKGVSTKFATKEAKDSSRIYGDRLLNMKSDDPIRHSTVYNYIRQYYKGQPGYDKMGYEKDSEGRSSTSKWYGFDPKTKKYTMGPNKGKTHAQVMKSKKG